MSHTTAQRLQRKFYTRPTIQVAQDLLGKYLVHIQSEETLVGKITEVEAYTGADDPASHAFRGRTPRNASMFLTGGHAYIYFIYGMHVCFNVVAGQKDTPGAVLIRAVEPREGIQSMLERRSSRLSHLTDGPGKLCQAFALTRAHDGIDLTTSAKIWIEDREEGRVPFAVSSRVGIRSGTDKLWRFSLAKHLQNDINPS